MGILADSSFFCCAIPGSAIALSFEEVEEKEEVEEDEE